MVFGMTTTGSNPASQHLFVSYINTAEFIIKCNLNILIVEFDFLLYQKFKNVFPITLIKKIKFSKLNTDIIVNEFLQDSTNTKWKKT